VLQALSISVLPAVMWTLMFCIVANAWLMPHASHPVRPENQTEQQFWRRLLKGPVAGFILLNVLLQLSFGPYYTFFSIYLGEAGYSASLTGIIWGVGVIAEVVLFWQFGRIMHLLSWRGWVVLSLALTAVRWMLTGYLIGSLWVLLLLQILHAFSFGVMHAVSMRYVQTLFPDHLQGRAQALYSSVSFGLGGAVGAWVSGLLWEPLGGTLVFVLAGAASLAGAVIAWLSLSPDEQRQSRQ
jgi:PPP family 3-phenylpropionic acid transporter